VARRELTPGAATGPTLVDRALAVAAAALVHGVGRAPTRPALAAGGALGRAWARLHGPRTGDARVNLRIAFPEWSEAEREAVLARSLANLARGVVELAEIPVRGAAALRERVAIEGLEHLEAARRTSPTGGVVVLTAHFGSWELLAAAMSAAGFPIAVVHRPRDNPALEEVLSGLRRAGGTQLLPRGSAARGALQVLREGRLLAIPYDQNCRREEGVFVPFFGRLACARDGPPRIALRTGVPVLPVFVFRRPDGFHHVARVRPALDLVGEGPGVERGDAVRENARRMTRAVEDAVREAPDHWIWLHRRWRTQPPGEAHPYGGR
jgi:KDO2-lipid IV(A) lauroyltransferase